MNHLFISYAHKDQDWIDCFVADLLDRGYSVWLDNINIELAEEWAPAIERGIEQAAVMCVIVSLNSQASAYVGLEIEHARKHNIPLIPIIIDDGLSAMPGNLPDNQGVDFRYPHPYVTAFEKLAKEIGITQSNPAPKWDIAEYLHDDSLTMGVLAPDWRTKLDIRFNSRAANAPVGLLIGRAELELRHTGVLKNYSQKCASAYLVAPKNLPLITIPDRLQVFLQFSGKEEDKAFENKYMNYIQATKTPLWTILVRGPVRQTMGGHNTYDLPISHPPTWMKAVSFIQNMIPKTGRKPIDFFLNTPNALIMALAPGLTRQSYRVFHYDSEAPNPENFYGMAYDSQMAR